MNSLRVGAAWATPAQTQANTRTAERATIFMPPNSAMYEQQSIVKSGDSLTSHMLRSVAGPIETVATRPGTDAEERRLAALERRRRRAAPLLWRLRNP